MKNMKEEIKLFFCYERCSVKFNKIKKIMMSRQQAHCRTILIEYKSCGGLLILMLGKYFTQSILIIEISQKFM